MANTILLIGLEEDAHTQEVQKQIKSLDSEVKVVLFNPHSDGHFIEITAGNVSELSPGCVIVVNGERIPAKSIKSVWYYLKPPMPPPDQLQDLQGQFARDFADKEWGMVLRSLRSYLSHARWLNPMAGAQLLNCKPYQLRLAQQVGLTVPKTCITNNPVAVEKIFDEVHHGRVIFKTMSPLFVPPDNVVFTTEITKEFPSKSRATMAQCPAIYQELVERKSDLRITVVGRAVFPVRISSQSLAEKRDRLDWRRHQDKDELFSEAQISESFKKRLLDFHEKAGLVYGAYDFLERGDDVIFLECNSGGAWLWLEHAVGLKVSEHIARYLLGTGENDSP